METTLKGIISFKRCFIFIIVIWLINAAIYYWWTNDPVVQGGVCEVCPLEIKSAMQKMGPLYSYRILPNGTLQVDKGNGEWLKLKYERKWKMGEEWVVIKWKYGRRCDEFEVHEVLGPMSFEEAEDIQTDIEVECEFNVIISTLKMKGE
jgi:hypothetical protein